MITLERMTRLAKAIGLTPTQDMKVIKSRSENGVFWTLVGCEEGERPIFMTGGAKSKEQAMKYVEEWYGLE